MISYNKGTFGLCIGPLKSINKIIIERNSRCFQYIEYLCMLGKFWLCKDFDKFLIQNGYYISVLCMLGNSFVDYDKARLLFAKTSQNNDMKTWIPILSVRYIDDWYQLYITSWWQWQFVDNNNQIIIIWIQKLVLSLFNDINLINIIIPRRMILCSLCYLHIHASTCH